MNPISSPFPLPSAHAASVARSGGWPEQVNGCRQRFLTKFLQVRLVELKKTVEERLEKLDAEAIEVEVRTTEPRHPLYDNLGAETCNF